MLTDEVILIMTKLDIPFDKQYEMLYLTVIKYIKQIKNVHKTYWQYCDLYSIAPVPQEEKFNYLLDIGIDIGDLYVEEIISTRYAELDFLIIKSFQQNILLLTDFQTLKIIFILYF